ncbi:LicD family protein [Lachnospiraceae bacterium LCP25S3_G4]
MGKYIMNKPYNQKVLKKLQQVQVEILKDFIEVCNKYNLTYFGVYGTAIGAVRHHGFIPWDDDTDVAMLREDYNIFLEVVQKELGDTYRIMTPETNPQYACTVTHLQRKNTKFIPAFCKEAKYEMCIDLDIFPLDYVAEDEKKQRRQSKMTNFLGRLLFLSGNKHPVINVDGTKGRIMELICVCIHYILCIFRIRPQMIYRWYLKEATAYNKEAGTYVTSFEYAGGIKDKVKVKELFPTYQVPFEDILIALPNNNEEFLQNVYGDYMTIPPIEQQINHAPYVIQFEGEEPIYS